jgi:EF hand
MKYFQKIIFAGMFGVVTIACAKTTTQNSQTAQTSPPEQEGNRPTNQQGNRPPNGGGRPQFSELLSKMDTNKDGKLSASEVQGPLKNNFSKIDTNNDGFITEAEFKNSPPPPPPNKQN